MPAKKRTSQLVAPLIDLRMLANCTDPRVEKVIKKHGKQNPSNLLRVCARLGIVYPGQLKGIASEDFEEACSSAKHGTSPTFLFVKGLLKALKLSFAKPDEPYQLQHAFISKIGADTSTPWRQARLVPTSVNSEKFQKELTSAWVETIFMHDVPINQLTKELLGYEPNPQTIQAIASARRVINLIHRIR